ncbi:perlucin-like [Asterias amurensis]|uniref:perlucin-like n=1 Tax=Asterias amurensis TaxID=7602 RepID=UPI003AB612E6
MHFLFDFKLLLLLAAIVHYGHAGCLCPLGWDAHRRHCYLYVEQPETFNTAESNCNAQAQGGRESHVTSVLDTDEAAFLAGYIQHGSAWIGLTDIAIEGNWVWQDGQPTGSQDWWYPNQPDNAAGIEDCVQMGANRGWNDYPCHYKLPYICKMLQRYQYRPH